MKRTRKAARRAVSRRPKRARREYFDVKRNMRDRVLREKWNNRKSPQANFAMFSIGDFEDQLADDDQLQIKTPEKKLNEMETKIISKLIEKHKDDYAKMSRDTKVNVYQWTATKCKNVSLSFLRGHCCVSSRKYLSHLIPNKQQQQQEEHHQPAAGAAAAAAPADADTTSTKRTKGAAAAAAAVVAVPASGTAKSKKKHKASS